jgi:uncharacterized protein YhfF
LSSVDDAFAWDEGEGDRTRRTWLADHEEFFERFLPTIGLAFEPDMLTVFERFEVLYSEGPTTRVADEAEPSPTDRAHE